MRISDWSSDVCSSDLPTIRMIDAQTGQADADVRMADAGRRSAFSVNVAYQRRDPRFGDYIPAGVTGSLPFFTRTRQNSGIARSEECRVGKESVRKCRSWWSPSY